MLPVFLQHCPLPPPLVSWAGWQSLSRLGEVSPLFALLFRQTDFLNFFFLISAFVLQLPRHPCAHRAGWCEERPGAQVWVAYDRRQEKE